MEKNRPPLAPLSRRDFIAMSSLFPAAVVAGSAMYTGLVSPARAADAPNPGVAGKKFPIGLELYSVRDALKRDLPDTLRTVAKIGYEVVEFYAPYFDWTPPKAKEVRTLMDGLGLRCFSTHNHMESFTPGVGMGHAIELNQILGARHLILASPPAGVESVAGWTRTCGQLTEAATQFKAHGLSAGFHNHRTEWKTLPGGQRVMDVIAANTPPEFVLQFDVGTCMEAGADPIAWIKANPGRIKSVHLKDWAPGEAAAEKGYRVLFGDGVSPWKDIFSAVESVGGVEFYLMEQEGSRFSEFETAQRCLETWKTMRGGV
jgi:sugar phosphate isomerase/epimerase